MLERLVEGIAGPIVSLVSSAIAFVLIYIVARILLSIAVAILAKLVESGVVGFVNGILGLVFTSLLTLFSVWALVAVSDLILNLPAVASTAFAEEFSGGFIYKFLKDLNPIDLLLSF